MTDETKEAPKIRPPCESCNASALQLLDVATNAEGIAPSHQGGTYCKHSNVAVIYTRYPDNRLTVSMFWEITELEATEAMVRSAEENQGVLDIVARVKPGEMH